MPPNPNRIAVNFTLEPELNERLDAFWHRWRFKNKAAAMKWLLNWALDQKPNPTVAGKQPKQ